MKKLLFSSSMITLFVMGINFLFKIYLSYHISKEEIGLFWTFLDLISIGIMLFSGFKDSLIRAYDKKDFHKVLYWYGISFLVMALVVVIAESIYFEILDFRYPLYFLIVLFVLNAVMIFFSYLNASYKNYKIMLFEKLVSAVGLVSAFFVFSQFTDKITALFFAFSFSYIIRVVYITYFSNIKWSVERSKPKEVSEFVKNTIYSGGMYFFSGLFISMSGIVILKLFQDTTVLAEYQVVVKSIFFSLVAVFVYPLNTFTFPQISKLISEKKGAEIKRIEKILVRYLFVFLLLLLAGTFFTKFIIAFVFPDAYLESYTMLNLLLPFLPFIAYTTFALNIIKAYDRFDLALYIRVAGTLSFFISIYLFYKVGMSATTIVYSLDISFFMMFGLSYYFKRKVLA